MPPDLADAVAAEVRRIVAERKWTGRELARRTGLPVTAVATKLAGTRGMDFTTLQAIAQACGVTVAYIVARAEAEVAHSPE